MSNKRNQFRLNLNTYVSGGRAMGKSSSAVKGGLRSAFSSVNSSSKKNTSSKKSSSSSSSRSTNSSVRNSYSSNNRSSRSYTLGSSNRSSYSTSSRNNSNLGYNLKKYMGQRGGTFGDKSYTKIGDDYYLKANPYSGIDMNKNNKPKLLKENQYNISEENREKINKGRINNYIKGINPYSAPPKNIRDAKAKESVESLMNNIQKRKNEQVKKENSLLNVSRLKNQIDNLSKINNGPLNTKNIKVDTLGYGFNGNNTTNAKKMMISNNIKSKLNQINTNPINNNNNLRYNNTIKTGMYNYLKNNQRNSKIKLNPKETKQQKLNRAVGNVSNVLNGFTKDLNLQDIKNKKVPVAPTLSNLLPSNSTDIYRKYAKINMDKATQTAEKHKKNFEEKYPDFYSSVNQTMANRKDYGDYMSSVMTDNYYKNKDKAHVQMEKVAKQNKINKEKNNERNRKISKFIMDNYYKPYNETNNVNVNLDYPITGSNTSGIKDNQLEQYYNNLINFSEYDSNQYKKILWDANKLKPLVDFFKRKSYEKSHTTTSIPKTTSEQLINNRVDYGDFRNAIPDEMIGKAKLKKTDNLDDKLKKEIVEKMELKYGSEDIEKKVKDNGGENLDFYNPVAISTNPAFKNQSLTTIENMSAFQRKITFVIAREKGQEYADMYMNYLKPELSSIKNKKALGQVNNSLSSLYGFATINDLNGIIDDKKTDIRSFFDMDNPEYNDQLDYVISNKQESGTDLERFTIKSAEEQNEMILRLLSIIRANL